MTVPADQLRSYLGVSDIRVVRGQKALAIHDTQLSEK